MKNFWLIFFLLSCATVFVIAQTNVLPPNLSTLFAAERAFAKRCSEVGIRASFMEFFADEAIVFRPHPVKYKEAMKDRPAPPNPLAFGLEWEPIYGEVSAAGDLGYDCGPSLFVDKTAAKPEPQYGFFFSVWKKQKEGNWKVVLDVGGAQTKTPFTGSREPQTFFAKEKTAHKPMSAEAERNSLLQAEKEFLQTAQTQGEAQAFARHLRAEAQVHRNGEFPIVGEHAITEYMRKNNFTIAAQTLFAEAAQSGDLGYTYGSYALQGNGKPAEKGHYARVWKRNAKEQWQVVLDTNSPLPPSE